MAFPGKGDRVIQEQYGAGTVLEVDTYHTVIDFDTFGMRRFATNMVVLSRTTDPGPSAVERREALLARARDERRQKRATMPSPAKKNRRA